MSHNNVLLLPELLESAGITEEQVTEWVKQDLLTSLGHSEDGVNFFSPGEADKARHIRDLFKLGYTLEEIRRIIRKVGIPGRQSRDPATGKSPQPLTIGILSERVGVSPRTIKHWEEKGIIEPDMRSSGGFRLYSEVYVYLCQLVRDLQLFGYSLDEIKKVSDHFRTFLSLQESLDSYPRDEAGTHLSAMQKEITTLSGRMKLLKEGIRRWENLLGKKAREITSIERRNHKRRIPLEEKGQ